MYSIDPLAVARYRERCSVARSKSDHADAMTLVNILRVDAHLHRRLPADTEPCKAIAVLARASQDAIRRHTKAHNERRAVLREFFPTFLAAFVSRFALGIASPEARAVLAIASTPTAAAKLSVTRIAAAQRRAGRSRQIGQTTVPSMAPASRDSAYRSHDYCSHRWLIGCIRWPALPNRVRGSVGRLRSWRAGACRANRLDVTLGCV